MDYRTMLEDGYAATSLDDPAWSRLEYLADHIFDFATYDSEMSELFATKAIEVCEAISNRKTFDYIKAHDNHAWFLVMCNLPFFADRIEWGTSIRGAWWKHDEIALASCGLFDGADRSWTSFCSVMMSGSCSSKL